jgi:RNA polymerase sigma factor (sigma-70 family)
MSLRRSPISVPLAIAPDPGSVTDADLARALIEGQVWAISQTWYRFAPDVVMLAKRTLGSESEADDLAQEVFHRVFAKVTTLREPERLRSFVFSFAIRLLKTELRSKRARAWLSFHKPETLLDLGADVVDMESRDLLRRFYSLLDRLSPRHRLFFVLRHVECMTVEEVAVHTASSTSTVKRVLERATSKLSKWIESDPGLAAFLEEFADGGGWRR